MRILFTGFTSRTVGSKSLYDYLSNVLVLRRALEAAGHEVDCRRVRLEGDDLEIEQHYDAAMIGIAACNGFSSRYKLGALWTMNRFGRRAGIFPSDGRNIPMVMNSVATSIRNPDTFLGYKMLDKNNIIDYQLGSTPQMRAIWNETLQRLRDGQHTSPMLVATFPWGTTQPYATMFKTKVTQYDPTNLAWPLQLESTERWAEIGERRRAWIAPSLGDQDSWLNKNLGEWHVIEVGNKRRDDGYVPELELLQRYRTFEGVLAFGYPMMPAAAGWWRSRFMHAAIAGAVLCCDIKDRQAISTWAVNNPYGASRPEVEALQGPELRALAARQYDFFFSSAWSAERAAQTVDTFVKGLA